MNNKIQRKFDRSIADAVLATKEANDRKPRRNLKALINAMPTERATGKGRLYLDPVTGATVWEPAFTKPSGIKTVEYIRLQCDWNKLDTSNPESKP